MSDTSVHSKSAKPARSTPPKPEGSKSGDLALVAERLSLIQGHINHMPNICISGARIMDGFLLVALKVNGHELAIDGEAWTLDGKDVTGY